ncbi:polysaccharide lyase family protein [Sinomonas terrae]|uniref:rhamnogalacturonan endolyase n=1 Tax=Sinomonas terrae TaxID=2908838 RepID=A0ABS9TW51_9MICC|nr:polysaccharide lyase family protein [Sinomonas terrae]MCH6468644.1 polysaccharide lyase family protein [Sinomonas terrae]
MQPDKSDQIQPAQREARPERPKGVSRRRVVQGLGGAAIGAALVGPAGVGTAVAAPTPGEGDGVKVLIGGAPAKVGSYSFPNEVPELVLDNGLVRAAFGRDDVGVPTGWQNVSITATSIVVAGTELAHNLNGVNPRDPDRQHSFYVDASGGKTRLVCSRVDVLRAEPGLVEVAFVDTTSTPLQHEHHLVMRSGHRGIYGYDIMTAVTDTSINEVRMNTRWDRSLLDHAYNWERGAGQQPTYAYLATQQSVQDETWRVDGVNNPSLPSPESNSGHLPAGSVYSKYDWSLYHHENPMFGHFGHGFGAWFTPLGGVTDDTLCAFYGAGPQHQDLAIHQDALILNYFSRNHYGEPAYPIKAGYRRLYGPWLTFFTVGDPSTPDAMIAEAARTARAAISEHRAGAPWMADSLYPSPAQRTTVTGRVRLADGRPAADFHVILSTQDSDSVFPIAEPTYFVKTDADGRFELPGIPPAWQPGSTAPGSYVLYVQPAEGSVTDLYRQPGVVVRGAQQDLGEIVWSPTTHGTFLWQIGRSDRTAGEYALATKSPVTAKPRGYEKPSTIPADLTFTIGQSWEPTDWYYAQTNRGTWTVKFTLERAYTGTAYLTVATAMQQGGAPIVAVNGNTTAITGTLPSNNDSTIARQADRSGYPRTALLSFPAGLLVAGENTITFAHGSPAPAGKGPGWDTLILEVDDGAQPASAKLTASVAKTYSGGTTTWQLTVRNEGPATAHDLRLQAITAPSGQPAQIIGRDPSKFAVPVAAALTPGASTTAQITVAGGLPITVALTADGGRTATTTAS